MLVQPTRRQLFRIHWRVGLGVEMGWDVIICGANHEAFYDHCEFEERGAESAGLDIQWILFIRRQKGTESVFENCWFLLVKKNSDTSRNWELEYFSSIRLIVKWYRLKSRDSHQSFLPFKLSVLDRFVLIWNTRRFSRPDFFSNPKSVTMKKWKFDHNPYSSET